MSGIAFVCLCRSGQRGAACSNSKPQPAPPPPSDPPKVFEPVFLQFEILGERVGAKGAEIFFLPFLRRCFFYPMCLYSKYSEFCGEFKNV